jgi:hypothetical protein
MAPSIGSRSSPIRRRIGGTIAGLRENRVRDIRGTAARRVENRGLSIRITGGSRSRGDERRMRVLQLWHRLADE